MTERSPEPHNASTFPTMWRFVFLAAFFLAPGFARAEPTTEGLYARFETSQGTFFCRLEYTLVPRTVANFVALADGTKNFIDYSLGKVTNRPFFNNLTFHRVVTNFVIQGGSPNGMGTDDPGYRFRDEFHPSLNHDRAGVLSMANSGTNSNGSQFFLTLSAAPFLNNKHAVFGEVVEGLDVVQEIGRVPVDANSKPLAPVYMTSVAIVRIGSAAVAFNAAAIQPPLPEPHGIRSELRTQGPSRSLWWSANNNSQYRIVAGTDLVQWSYGGIFARGPLAINPSFPRLFLKVFETNVDL
jgi:cyclophilin family peptidyl-prolyl cis-trans isomerase